MDLMIRWSTIARQFGIEEYPYIIGLVFMWTLAIDDRDKELKTLWEFMVLWEYRRGDYHEVWSTRDHSSLVKSTYEEHICVVALTRGT